MQYPICHSRFCALCVSLAFVLAALLTAAPAKAERLNIVAPTWGGTQFWADTYIHAGWRIQKNVLTGHYRLLDPKNYRRAWGTLDECRSAFEDIRQQERVKPSSPHLVLLIHGIARSSGTFSKLQSALRGKGYDVTAISYPSTRDSIEAHAIGIEKILNGIEGPTTVSFVTHSMGGLVVRHVLARGGAWKQRLTVHRVVQIAPPNQGSAVANRLANFEAYKLIFGKSGQQLTTERAASIPQMTVPFAIIAGGKNDGAGFNPLMPGDDDGTVKVSETRLAGAADFLVVPETHRNISNNPQSIRAVLNFLKSGSFAE